MSKEILPPLVPCGSCPYRKDVPSGVWHESEYAKLIEYDKDTGAQPFGVFLCHQQNGHVCAGWAGCHNPGDMLGMRLGLSFGTISSENYDKTCDYKTTVPLFESGAAAAAHGLRKVKRPPKAAVKVIESLTTKRARLSARG